MAALQPVRVPRAPLHASLPHPSLLHKFSEPNPNWKRAMPCKMVVQDVIYSPFSPSLVASVSTGVGRLDFRIILSTRLGSDFLRRAVFRAGNPEWQGSTTGAGGTQLLWRGAHRHQCLGCCCQHHNCGWQCLLRWLQTL